jgi:bifunctional non-homologous end joining protein LigD
MRDAEAPIKEHHTGEGSTIFKHACALGCEGIVSKRLGSPYRSGRTDHWLKVKNPAAPAVAREAEKDGADKPELLRRKDKRP